MSFGLSSGGGQVRYALVVDDQATTKLNTFKNSLTQLGTATTQTSSKMAIMNNTFSAGVTPIKNTGNAMNQLVGTQKTLTSQLGSIGTAFRNNALAIGAAASSVLGLYQNYANLSSAQNAANKSATAAKAAQNSVTTATKNLSKAIDQYGAGSKEAKAAQDKLTVAQERAVNKTESAKIAQDNLNQTMADFGINILPNIILAGGSIVSIFDNIGKSGSGVTGIMSKLAGAIGGIGGGAGGLKGLFTTITSGLSGIATNGPAAGAGMTAFAGGVDKAALSLKATIGLLSQAAALIAGFAIGGQIKQQIEGLTGSQQAFHDATINTLRALGLAEPQLKKISDILSGVNEVLGQGKLEFHGLAGAIANTVQPSQELAAAQEALNKAENNPALKSHVTDTANAAKATLAHAQAEVKRLQAVEPAAAGLLTLGKNIQVVANNTVKAITPTEEWIAGLIKTKIQTIQTLIDLREYAELHGITIPAAIQNDVKAIQDLIAKRQGLNTVTDKAIVLEQDLAKQNQVGTDFLQRFADANAIAANKMDDFNLAITAGQQKFQDFVTTTQTSAVINKQYEAGLRSIVGAYVELNPNIDLTTSQLEEMTKSIIEGKGAYIAYADIVAKRMAPAVATFQGLLDTKNMKEFNSAFKDLELGKLDKGLSKGIKKAFEPLRDVTERSGELIHLFDTMADVGGELSEKNIGKMFTEMASGFDDIAKQNPAAKEFGDTILSYVKNAPNMAEAWKNVNPVMQKFGELTKDGNLSLDDYNAVTELFNTTIGKTVDPTNQSAAAIKAFGVSSASARGQIDEVTGAVDVLKAAVSTAKLSIPSVDQTVFQKGLQLAINNAGQTVKFITSTLKKVSSIQVPSPNEKTYQKGLQLAINNAAQTVKLIKKALDGIGKISVPEPKFNKFNSALDQAVSDAKRAVRDINNALTKVKKPSGQGSGPGATTGPFNTNSSKADSGNGVIIIETHQHVMDQDIVRRFKAEQGKARYRFGLG